MRIPDNYQKLTLYFLAVIFGVTTLLSGIVWIIDAHTPKDLSRVVLGFNFDFNAPEQTFVVSDVFQSSPAEVSGLRAGDRILQIDGRRANHSSYIDSVWRKRNPGDTVRLTIARPGMPGNLALTAVFELRESLASEGGMERLAGEIRNLYVVPFILVGLGVLFLRVEDVHAWLLALLFAGFTAVGGANGFQATPALRSFAMGYRAIFGSLIGPVFYFFFALFPTRSPFERKVPWLKWGALVLAMSLTVTGFKEGESTLPPPLYGLAGRSTAHMIAFLIEVFFVVLGLVSLIMNFVEAHDAQVRRKIRVILWGTGLGVFPIITEAAAENLYGFRSPNWLETILVFLLLVFPISFAYAVVRHSVMEIPALIKRSARYLFVQRGFTFILALVSISLVLVFAMSLPEYLRPFVQIAPSLAIVVGSMFGTVLLWGGTQVHRRVSGKIDKAFFRTAYDARLILENLAERSAAMTNREELASSLDRHISEALQPLRLTIYLRTTDAQLACFSQDVPQDLLMIPMELPFLRELARRGEPADLETAKGDQKDSLASLAPLHPECLVPMVARGGHLAGLLVLGTKRSEEPYSGEDKRLLYFVATQAATALENIRLAEEIAQRIEDEQRVARETEMSRRLLEADNARKTKELEEARQLQLSMLPATLPALPGVELAVLMKTATEVGGDYYDFFIADDGTLTVALGDATGHGLKAGTMVVAAKSLLSSFSGLSDLLEIFSKITAGIKKLNMRPLYMSMLLLRVKDRALSFASAGMPCPLVYRAKKRTVEEIPLKGMPLGAFADFPYEVLTTNLEPGDTVVLMSDGLPEMFNEKEELLGSASAVRLLSEIGHKTPQDIVDALAEMGKRWADGEPQQDDMTFVVVKIK